MIVSINKNWVHILLFTVAVVVSYSTNYEIQFAIWTLIAVFYFLGNYSKKFLVFLLCYVAIVVLGLIRTIFYDHSFYFTIRDLTYFLKPIIGLIIGYQIFKNKKINYLKAVIYISAFLAISHFLLILFNLLFYSVHSINHIRAIGGYFSDFEVFAIIILLFHKKFELNFSRPKFIFLLGLISVSVIFYFARTNIIQFVILGLGMLGFYKMNAKNIVLFVALASLVTVGYLAIANSNPKRSSKGIDGFLYKIKNAPYEVYDPFVKNDNSVRFHDRFRSYETKVTIMQMQNRKDAGIWLGNGFGSVVNYGTKVGTTDGYRIQFAPILHNGYTTIFLKVGLIGLAIYIYSLLYLSFYGYKHKNYRLQNIKILINSSGIFMFLSSLVFLGFYLKLDNKSLFLGGLIAYYEGQTYLFNTKNQENKIALNRSKGFE